MIPIYFAAWPIQGAAQRAYAELAISTVERSIPLNDTANTIEVKVSSVASAISPLTLMLNINDESANSGLGIQELRAYDSQSNSYLISADQNFHVTNGSRVILDDENLPSGLPAGGGLGILTETWNGDNAELEVTVVFVSDSNAAVSIAISNPPRLPYDVIQQHYTMEITGNSTDQEISVDNAFVDPEIHCETCSAIEYRPNGSGLIEAAYVTNATDLSLARNMTWWAMGDGEVTFHVAGSRGVNDTISYGKQVAVALGDEWQHVEVDLAGINLREVTHPFGFSLAGTGERTFYLKGVMFE
jgi:hypothetical protein